MDLHAALKYLQESSGIEVTLKTRNTKAYLNIVSTSAVITIGSHPTIISKTDRDLD